MTTLALPPDADRVPRPAAFKLTKVESEILDFCKGMDRADRSLLMALMRECPGPDNGEPPEDVAGRLVQPVGSEVTMADVELISLFRRLSAVHRDGIVETFRAYPDGPNGRRKVSRAELLEYLVTGRRPGM